MLHFGAVDYHATVWLNGLRAGHHEGGYTPFSFDITPLLIDGRDQELVVRADDDPADLTQAARKTGLAAAAALDLVSAYDRDLADGLVEIVPASSIDFLRWTPNLERWELGFEVGVVGEVRAGCGSHVRLSFGDTGDRRRLVPGGRQRGRTAASRCPTRESTTSATSCSGVPNLPRLIDATLATDPRRARLLDQVASYTALRSVTIQRDRFVLNGRPYAAHGARPGLLARARPHGAGRCGPAARRRADQGDGLQRRPQAPEGRGPSLSVLGRPPRPARVGRDAERLPVHAALDRARRPASGSTSSTATTAIPCIVTWVPFNESWGVPNCPTARASGTTSRPCIT